jgi:nucleoid DNA-binding protein
MTKAELVEPVATIVQFPKHQVDELLTRCLQRLMDVVHKGNTIELRGWGAFGFVIAQRIQDTTHARGHVPDAGQSCACVYRGESLPSTGATPTAPSRYADDVDACKQTTSCAPPGP